MRASPVIAVLRVLTWYGVILLAVLSLLPGQWLAALSLLPEMEMVRAVLPAPVEHFIASDAAGPCRRNRDAELAQRALGQSGRAGNLFPAVATIGGAKQTAARAAERFQKLRRVSQKVANMTRGLLGSSDRSTESVSALR
jgi:hypothetical protein